MKETREAQREGVKELGQVGKAVTDSSDSSDWVHECGQDHFVESVDKSRAGD